MPGPAWDGDDPADARRLAGNVTRLVRSFQTDVRSRRPPSATLACDWHRALYAGCTVPSPQYVGAFRGAVGRPDLQGYEVGVGPRQPDGLPERVGVWSRDVADQVDGLMDRLAGVLAQLDGFLPVGVRPTSSEELGALTDLVAQVHGEWVRIHPFANGNGRTARTWGAWLALRYGLPVFLSVKPRPREVGYAAAARASMGRPPDFLGDHRPAQGVFADLLIQAMRP